MINALDSWVKSSRTVFPWLHSNSNIVRILLDFFFIYVMLLLYLPCHSFGFPLCKLEECLFPRFCARLPFVILAAFPQELSRKGKPWFLLFSPRPSELSVLCSSFDRQRISLFRDSTLVTDKLVIFLLLNHVRNFVPAAGKYEHLKDLKVL